MFTWFKTQKQQKVYSEKTSSRSDLHSLESSPWRQLIVNLFPVYPFRDVFNASKSKHKHTYTTGKIVNVLENYRWIHLWSLVRKVFFLRQYTKRSTNYKRLTNLTLQLKIRYHEKMPKNKMKRQDLPWEKKSVAQITDKNNY